MRRLLLALAGALGLCFLLLVGFARAGDQPALPPVPAQPGPGAQAVTPTTTFLPEGPTRPGVGPLLGPVETAPTVPDWVQGLSQAGGPQGVSSSVMFISKTLWSEASGLQAFNGELVTYTIQIRNTTDTNQPARTLRNITLLDVLPQNALAEIACTTVCFLINESLVISEPLGGNITLTRTAQISWPIPSLAPGSVATRRFVARVVGQTDGSIIKNQAFVTFDDQQNGQPVKGAASSPELNTTVLIPLVSSGGPSISRAPTWFSSDAGGTLSQDIGDFDGDGDLDMAFGSSIATTVYRNENGRLRRLWGAARPAFGVRFSDMDGDGRMELVAVGDDNFIEGINYIYRISNGTVQEFARFTTLDRIARLAPGDFDRDGDTDLLLSTNSINAVCPVLLYLNDGSGGLRESNTCVSDRATAALSPGDWDNDGDLDLAVGLFPAGVELLINDGSGGFTAQVPIDTGINFLPYDFAWGDFNSDGFLDLAAAFPLQRQARIYQNFDGLGFFDPSIIRTDRFLKPLSVDWGDFTGDGSLNLAVADLAPTIYERAGSGWQAVERMSTQAIGQQVWSIKGADLDNDGDLDLILTNRDGPSQVFTTFAPVVARTLSPVPAASDRASAPASGVLWADFDNDGLLDLLFGAGPPTAGTQAVSAKLYFNRRGSFARDEEQTLEGFGPHALAVGDATRDGALEIAVGSAEGTHVHLTENLSQSEWESGPPGQTIAALAWGDADDDQDLDLLAASVDGSLALYRNTSPVGSLQLSAQPVWQQQNLGNVQSIAWADLNGDSYLDFAVGRDGLPNQIYLNNRSQNAQALSFRLAAWTPRSSAGAVISDSTRALGWGDYDGDGDLDLAVGNYGEENFIYENRATAVPGFRLSETPHPISPIASRPLSKTTALDWGDWDGDGDLDLAIGNDGENDVIFVNRRDARRPGTTPQFFAQWLSSEVQRTTGIAFGDVDNDGDLDLAVSQQGGGTQRNGFYKNTLIQPAHLSDDFAKVIALPNNPTYLSLGRPGTAYKAYGYSSPEVLSGPNHPTVTVPIRVYDPDGERNLGQADAVGLSVPMRAFSFEYSLNNGSTWRKATSARPITPTDRFTPTRLGTELTFIWDAQKDAAISENARFRVQLAQTAPVGPVAFPVARAESPPFRVRGTTCIWPEGAGFVARPTPLVPGTPLVMTGFIVRGTGVLSFTWDFGDGSPPVNGQRVSHTYSTPGQYAMRLTVSGEDCPRNRPQTITQTVQSSLPFVLYYPLISNGTGPASAQTSRSQPPAPPGQIPSLTGQASAAGLTLLWQPPADGGPVSGYRIYRSRAGASFQPVASVGPQARTYAEPALCDAAYFVVAWNDDGEGPASAQTFRSQPCPGGQP